jgi:hypothetical protein
MVEVYGSNIMVEVYGSNIMVEVWFNDNELWLICMVLPWLKCLVSQGII